MLVECPRCMGWGDDWFTDPDITAVNGEWGWLSKYQKSDRASNRTAARDIYGECPLCKGTGSTKPEDAAAFMLKEQMCLS